MRAPSSRSELTDKQDPYAILHVARTAPDSVIKAAHKAHGHAKGSDEAKAADEAYALLSTKGALESSFTPAELMISTEKRAEYDSKPANRSTGGTGFDVEGGSDLLAQLGRALGLKFPEGFVWPASGRFQGGFGGGFEYTWGETEAKAEGA